MALAWCAPTAAKRLAVAEIRKSAHLSPGGLYRYRLARAWGSAPALGIVMLNPSTADADIDDPTIRRCMSFARREGYGGIDVANLFPFRTPSPKALKAASDPLGRNADRALRHLCRDVQDILCGWGAHGAWRNRAAEVIELLQSHVRGHLYALKYTQSGQPMHPLYLKADTPFLPFPC